MTQAEFVYWHAFFHLFPFDDLHRIHRPAALIASMAGGNKTQELLDWLQPDTQTQGLKGNEQEMLRYFRAQGSKRKGG